MSPTIRPINDPGTMKLRENPSPLINYHGDDLHEYGEEDNTEGDGEQHET